MDPKIVIRAIAVALLAGSVLACAVEVGRWGTRDTPDSSASDHSDPSAAELLRCTKLGTQALTDAACQAAWAKNRQHFFGAGRAQPGRRPDIFPASPDTLPTKAPPKTDLGREPSALLPNIDIPPGVAQEER